MNFQMEDVIKHPEKDLTGMDTYEYLVNHVDSCYDQLPQLIENLRRIDKNGQFLASSARFLNAVDPTGFKDYIEQLVNAAIDKDRERKYIGSLLEALWGQDYQLRANELQKENDCFRRIFKRLFPEKSISNTGHLI